MLVLTRSKGQSIIVGEKEITFTIVSVINGQVRVGIKAPSEITVHRSEIYQRIINGEDKEIIKAVNCAIDKLLSVSDSANDIDYDETSSFLHFIECATEDMKNALALAIGRHKTNEIYRNKEFKKLSGLENTLKAVIAEVTTLFKLVETSALKDKTEFMRLLCLTLDHINGAMCSEDYDDKS